MHVSSHDNMRRSIKLHVLNDQRLAHKAPLRVLDVGGSDVNGSYRSLFEFTESEYVSVDLATATGAPGSVDVTVDPTGPLPFPDGHFDIVISGQTLEHSGQFWTVFAEMTRVCHDHGVIVLIVPSAGGAHRFPVDCYRFMPDAAPALAEANGLLLVDSYTDRRGPFHDLVAVFRKEPAPPAETTLDHTTYNPLLDGALQNDAPGEEVPEHELNAGAMYKPRFLRQLHKWLQPRFYLEIGVYDGVSLRIAKCPALGVDPFPRVEEELPEHHRIHTGMSADFFGSPELVATVGPLDLSYIDGMHLIENAFEDFVNIESLSHPLSMILVDDIYPNHPQQGLRSRDSLHWTGDVWKIIPILEQYRPDLILIPVDTFPTGTLIVLGAEPLHTTLWEAYDLIVEDAINATEIPPASILERHGALAPNDPLLERICKMLLAARDSDDPRAAFERVRRVVQGAFPRKVSQS